MKQKAKLFVMLMTMLIGHISAWGETETITFVQTSTTAGTLTANEGFNYTFSNTYTNNKEQITSGNSMTLTITGFKAGDKITGITLHLRNNKNLFRLHLQKELRLLKFHSDLYVNQWNL